MIIVIVGTIVYSLVTAFSIMLLGDRNLISMNLTEVSNILKFILNWKFILSMILAIGSRVTFIYINNALVKIPELASNSTTLTAFISAISYAAIIMVNFLFLNEKLTFAQGGGALLIMVGIWLMLK